LFKTIFFLIVRQEFLFLKVLFERDAVGHDSGELNMVHDVVAVVVRHVLFHHLFEKPSNAGGQAVRVAESMIVFTSFLLDVAKMFAAFYF